MLFINATGIIEHRNHTIAHLILGNTSGCPATRAVSKPINAFRIEAIDPLKHSVVVDIAEECDFWPTYAPTHSPYRSNAQSPRLLRSALHRDLQLF